jgi:hypothetical protein
MKKLLLPSMFLLLLSSLANSQGLLKRVGKKAEQMINEKMDRKTTTTLDSTTDRGLRKTYDKAVDKPLDDMMADSSAAKKKNQNAMKATDANDGQISSASSNSSKTRATNRKGAGLKPAEAPDISTQLNLADSTYKIGEIKESRRALKLAIHALEMKIAANILQSFPEKIDKLEKIREQDQVQSSDIGWYSMFISRTYVKDDQEFVITISNGGANGENMASLIYDYKKLSQTVLADASVKEIKIKNHKGYISFSESSGYQLEIPLSKNNSLKCEGVNFEDEDSFVAAVNTIDIDGIKRSMNLK